MNRLIDSNYIPKIILINQIMKIAKPFKVGGLSFKYHSTQRNAVGFIVSKRYGNAVKRNLFKRRCRNVFTSLWGDSDLQVSVIVYPVKQNISFREIDNSFRTLYDKICA